MYINGTYSSFMFTAEQCVNGCCNLSISWKILSDLCVKNVYL